MALKVDNLANLWWDNGSFKQPNTYPKLVGGEYLERVTPVMASPLAGWVILKGKNYNYCEFRGELFFLKKSHLISDRHNKWRYILIKDHWCTLLKNKANVIAKGVLINTDLKHLKPEDYQFTFPVFNSYSKRILLPLDQEVYDWRKHCIPVVPEKNFQSWKTTGNKEFSLLIRTLEQNRDLFGEGQKIKGKKPLEEILRDNKYFVLFGKTERSEKVNNWKNQLWVKIKEFLNNLKEEHKALGTIPAEIFPNSFIQGHFALVDLRSKSIIKFQSENKEIDINLNGITDIKLHSLVHESIPSRESYREEVFTGLTLTDNQSLLEQEEIFPRYVKKLSRRVRLSFLNKYSSRAIYKSGGRWSTFFWTMENGDFFAPQKLFFKIDFPLKPKTEFRKNFPAQRNEIAYRSVYLYYCWNLDFTFTFNKEFSKKQLSWHRDKPNFIEPSEYFKEDSDDVRKQVSENLVEFSGDGVIEIKTEDNYKKLYPWADSYSVKLAEFTRSAPNVIFLGIPSLITFITSQFSGSGLDVLDRQKLKFPFNIGWLVGQFITFDSFFSWYPFIVSNQTRNLSRIKGLKPLVESLVCIDKIYEGVTTGQLQREPNIANSASSFELSIFNPLVPRARQATLEEDFLIGEKMLFTTWGFPVYLLFQPTIGKEYNYAYYQLSGLDKKTLVNPQGTLVGKWFNMDEVGDLGWVYPYYVFGGREDGSGQYFGEEPKKIFKKAYENFKELEYENRYRENDKYKELMVHYIKNTQAYFETEEIDLTQTPLGTLNENDIFFSDLEWFFFDQSQSTARDGEGLLSPYRSNDWLIHKKDKVEIEDGDVVIYALPTKPDRLFIGSVKVWDSKVQLPPKQYIAQSLDNDSSEIDEVAVKYTKISSINGEKGFNTFDDVINALKENQDSVFDKIADYSLEQILESKKAYLFDLVGTAFYCYLDVNGYISLIVKKSEKNKVVKPVSQHIYTVSPRQETRELEKSQWVNQKLVFSFYGEKIELPTKVVGEDTILNITIDTPNMGDRETAEVVESKKVEIKHKLGTLYFRVDIPKNIATNRQGTVDTFIMEGLTVDHHRHLQDYLISRKQWDMSYHEMDIAHRTARMERRYAYINASLGLALGAISGISAGAMTKWAWNNALSSARQKAIPNMEVPNMVLERAPREAGVPYWLVQKGFKKVKVEGYNPTRKEILENLHYKPVSVATKMGAGSMFGFAGAVRGITNLFNISERAALQDEGMALEIQKKALESYQIDLNWDRAKQDYLFNARRLFSYANFSETTGRQRQKELDKLEAGVGSQLNEIYLELWTVSEKQKDYVETYHDKFGVDCRVETMLSIKNGIEEGIYCLEDVEVLNLQDRIEIEVLKAKLHAGIKIMGWKEHEKVEELVPVDPMVTKLRKALDLAREKQKELEVEKNTQKEQLDRLETQYSECAHREEELHSEVESTKSQNADLRRKAEADEQQLKVKEEQVKVEQRKYSTLSESYRRKEEELAETKKVSDLYKDESIKLKASEKELQGKLATRIQENKDLLKRIETIELEKKQSEREKANLEAQAKELETRAEQKDAEIQKKAQELEEQKRALEKEKEERIKEKEKLELDVASEKEDLRICKEQLEEEKANHSKELQTYQQTAESYAKAVEQLRGKEQTWKDEKTSLESELNKLKQQLEEKKFESPQNGDGIGKQEEWEKLQKEYQDLQREKNQLEDSLKEAKEWKSELEETKKSLEAVREIEKQLTEKHKKELTEAKSLKNYSSFLQKLFDEDEYNLAAPTVYVIKRSTECTACVFNSSFKCLVSIYAYKEDTGGWGMPDHFGGKFLIYSSYYLWAFDFQAQDSKYSTYKEYYKDYIKSHFTTVRTGWGGFIKDVAPKGNVNAVAIKAYSGDKDFVLPYFLKNFDNGKIYSKVQNEYPVYWDEETKKFTKVSYWNGVPNKPIRTYQDYCNALEITPSNQVIQENSV